MSFFASILSGLSASRIFSNFCKPLHLNKPKLEFIWLTSPKSFVGEKKVTAVEVNKMKLGEPDSSGRRKPEIQKDSNFNIKADIVIKALGFDAEDLPNLFDSKDLKVTKWGTLKVDFDDV